MEEAPDQVKEDKPRLKHVQHNLFLKRHFYMTPDDQILDLLASYGATVFHPGRRVNFPRPHVPALIFIKVSKVSVLLVIVW